jgi:O-antigen/teichoic acid export membrane protein
VRPTWSGTPPDVTPITGQPSPASTGLGSLATGAVTALAIAVQTGLAAVVGVVIARELGRTAETDGFFAAYGVFIVLALAANAVRVTVLPRLARARDDRRLSSETAAYAVSIGVVAVPVLVLGIVFARPIADVLTGSGPQEALDAAAEALPWMILAGVGQFTAGLLASALAALDDYVVAASGYITGSVAGLVLILVRIEQDGTIAVAWGMALNATIATLVPAAWLARRARSEAMPRSAARANLGRTGGRLLELLSGAALPFALQAVYLVCLPLAAREGVGAVTSFGYAYLVASAIVAVTASSLGLVTSVPLTRAGLDPGRVARHVDASSWLALVVVAATAGVFAVAGADIVARVLGASYSHDVGSQIGQLVVALAPFMVVSVALSVTFPLVFIARRTGRLPLIAGIVLLVHVPLAVLGQVVAGLWGLSIALAVSTAIALALMLVLLDALRATVGDLLTATVVVGATAAVIFALGALLLEPPAAATLALLAYVGTVLAVRPRGLVRSWDYLRALR